MKAKNLLSFLLLFCISMQLAAQTIDRKFYTTDGAVRTTLQSGNTVYLGGDFNKLGIQANRLARINSGSTKPDITFPQFDRNSSVYAAEPDGSGGFYVGGYLYNFNGTALPSGTSLVHILSNGSLDGVFTNPTTNSSITSLKKKNNVLYVGGYFSVISDSSRQFIAAIDATTGAVLSWNPPDVLNTTPTQIEASDTMVFVKGPTYIGNYSLGYSNFAALSANTGNYIRNFPTFSASVTSMLVDNNTLYAGGSFANAGALAQGMTKFNSTTSIADGNYPNTNGAVYASLPDGSGGFYIGGSFTTVGNTGRTYLAHILANGTVDPAFNVTLNNQVNCMATDGTNLYFGGFFNTVNSTTRNYAAAVSIGTGTLQTWNPNANSYVIAMAYSNNIIYMGGYFSTIKGSSRSYAAAVTTANALTNWVPNPNNLVRIILPNATGTFVYIGGEFTTVKGATRNYIAKVDVNSGNLVNSWNPNPNGSVYALALNGATLYMGGYFAVVKATYNRQYFAALDTASATPTSLIVDANDGVRSFLISSSKLYLSGYFTSLQGLARSYIGRIDLTTGNVDSWSPQPNGNVQTLSIANTDIFAGGEFVFINNAAKNQLAAIDLSTNSLTAWNPQLSIYGGSPSKIIKIGSDIIAGGSFYYTDGVNNIYNLLFLDASTGNLSHSISQYPNSTITDMAIANGKLFLNGGFSSFYDVNTTQTINRQYMADYSLSNYQLSNNLYEPDTYAYEGGGNMFADGSGNIIIANQGYLWNTVSRTKLAAIDVTTGIPTSWAPNPSGSIYCLAIKDTSIFVGGAFTVIGTNALARSYLAAVSINTGKATNWKADLNSYPYAISLQDTILYVGGSFTTIKGASRNYAAAVTTGAATVQSWNPGPNSTVNAVQSLPAAAGGDVFLGGYFSTVKGSNRQYLARVNNGTGGLISWNPSPNSYITTFALNGNTLYVGGNYFSTISGQPRNALAAYDINGNTIKPFDTKLKYSGENAPNVYSLAVNGKELFIAADPLDSLNGASRGRLAGSDTTTAAATSFNPLPDGAVISVSVGTNKLYAGGSWYNINATVVPSYFAAYTTQPQTQASALNFSNVQTQNATATWTIGNGESRMGTIKQGGTPGTPNDGKTYTANAAYGSGQTTGAQSYTISNGTGNTVNITNLLPNHSYTLSVFEYNGTGSATDYLQSPALTGSFTTPCPTYSLGIDTSGPLALCPGGSVTLTAPAGFSSYLWSTTATAQAINANAAGNYSVTYTDSNGCAGSASRIVSIKTVTPPSISPVSQAICQGSSGTLTASSGYSNYLWSTAATTQVISVNTAGSFTVSATENATGCTATSSAASVSINPLPSVNITAGGPTTFCQGGSVTLTANAGLSSYLWSNGATTQSTTVNSSSNYTCNGTDANGCTGTSNSITVTVNPTPAKPIISPSGSTTNVCPGKTVTLTSSAGTTYLWNTGATTQSIVVSAAGNYSVRVSNASGCQSVFSDPTAVTYATCGKTTNLTTTNITSTSAKLNWTAVTCAVGYQYEWRKKGTTAWTTAQTNLVTKSITGLTSSTTYQWRVITACKITPDTLIGGYSNGPEFTTLAVPAYTDGGNGDKELKAYAKSLSATITPNPANSIASVIVTNAKGNISIQLTDLSGKTLWQTITASNKADINLSRYAGGTYLVIIKDEKESRVMKLIKE